MIWSGNRHEKYTDYSSMMTVHTDEYREAEIQLEGRGEIQLNRTQVEVLVQQLQDWLERTKVE